MRSSALFISALLALATVLPAELIDAQIEESNTQGSLSERIDLEADRAREPIWIAYEVPMVESGNEICCGLSHGGGSCGLEQRGLSMHSRQDRRHRSDTLLVLLRVDKGTIERVRVFTESCRVRAEESRIVWMQGIDVDESVTFLRSLAYTDSQVDDEALTALALHDSSNADRVLEEIATSDRSSDLRGEAVFWLGEMRGEAGFQALQRVLATDPPEELRGEIAFALSESPEPAALDTLIAMAQSDSSSEVRGQAIFWLAQHGGARAEKIVFQAVTDDPESEVRNEAVFALSELPDGSGVDRLIQVAGSKDISRSARREAIFWLGQSEDPRALEFFDEVLQP